MKKVLQQLLLLVMVASVVSSCDKDENQVIFEGGTAPVLNANRTGDIPLAFVNQDDDAISFSWTNPDYYFNTGISSQDVTYTLEIDTLGANFGSPNIKRQAISRDLSISFKQGQFNDFLLNQLVLTPNRPYTIEVRVISNLFNNNSRLTSNTLSFQVTPYPIPPKVTPPGTPPDYLDGKLFIVGSATPGGWANPVPIPSQELTRVSATLYEIIMPVVGGGSYLFLPVNGDWGAKFGGVGSSNNTNNPNSDDFKAGGSDLLAPAASGVYKIEVDFQRGKFTFTPQ